ncbi:cilia- and flagella-associated protein 74-like, partial [Lingula anatina]|uniref:Cilia- and flagella-associated protein 74-like n=1 Tax=Lingula anatina TaxID=7574 RepID=A0A1S3J1E4_LINAN
MMDLDFDDMATPIPMDEDFEQPSQTDLFESVIGRGYGESEDGAFSDSEEEEEVYARSGGDFPKTTEQRINRQEQLRMLHLRRYLDQLSEKVLEKDYIVQKTRQELQKCRERLEQLERERDQVFAQMSACDAEGNVSAVNRLQAQHERVLQELEDEETLEEKIKETLDSAEYELAKAQVEQGKFLLADEELRKKEEQLKEEKLQMAQTRKKKEDHFAAQTEKRRRAREKEHIEAIRERERRQRQAMLDAKKSREKAKVYLKETMARIRSQDLAEEQKNREEMEKRMSTALSLKTDIMKNRENLKALQARDRAVERAAKEAEERERQRILEEGGNPEEALLREKRQAEFDKLKEQHESRQRQHQVEIAQRILLEEQRMKKRMIQQPQLWNDPKREKAKRVAPHKRRKLRIFQESESSSHEYSGDVEDENRPPMDARIQMDSSDEEKGVHSSPYGTISRAELPDSDSETEANVDLAKPEFEGMWDKHKPYRVPKDAAEPIIKHPGASKMEQDIMVKVLDRHRENIVSKQVAAGREFKGCPFYSKPDVIHFKDFDVGKSYKKKVTLTNVSYTVNYCKLLGITEHLKDFIDVLFDPPGQMSAGLTCEMLVTFKPMINEDLEGEVNFLAQTGPFSIPIKCTTKKCDLSVDTRVIDFGTTVIGETLKRTFTLTNNGALGTRFEFVKISGMKQRNISTAETSIGRLTTADTARVPSPLGEAQEDKKGKGKKAAKEAAAQDKEKDKAPARPAEAEAPQETEAPKEKVTLKEPGLESEITSTVGFPLSTEAEELDSFDGMKVGQLIGGEIGPFTSLKLEILWNPTYPGAVDSDFLVTFTDELSAEISVKALGNAIDVPVWVQRQSVDLKICMYDRLYQDTIIANNRATTALRLNFDVPKELKNHLELLPKTGYIQAQSQFQAQLKFLPRSTLFEDAGKYFDKETGVLEAPMTIRVADQ